jgi:hypothetical protein
MLMDSLLTAAFGALAVLASYGKIQLSKDPAKNQEYLGKYGKLLRILGFLLIITGVALAFAGL